VDILRGLGLAKYVLCRQILVFREISSQLVMKSLILWMFLLVRIVLDGKLRSNRVLKSSQKLLRLSFVSLELYKLFHDRFRSWVRNLSMLVWFSSLNVLVGCRLVLVGGLIAIKLVKWSLMSVMIVPIVMLSVMSMFVKMWSIREWELP
jgi:hypothetical protein